MVNSNENLIRPAFTATRTEEERAKDTSETVSLKLNLKERTDLEADKELLDIGPDSAAIKILISIGRKVIRDTFSEGHLRYLSSQKRVRYDGRKSKARSRNVPKVLPELGLE